ncbi:WhiB family transcriptional regulator [Bifidobacterium longum]|uniref:WhiB family transcriptional regulator n=1 Tax=Bifidobacterium longum TaxID=216816 RepID=UPI0018996EA2|nr:WhiB family transcriptional regulator [Bifidobacterium longum]MDB6751577.1 WhiB family transcriptional regulator [Bifidobacterium longum]
MFLKGECADFPDSWSDRMWGPDDLPNQRTQYELRRAAVRICEACPVSAECLAFGIMVRDQYGIYGGLPLRARRQVLKTAQEAGFRFDPDDPTAERRLARYIRENPEIVAAARERECKRRKTEQRNARQQRWRATTHSTGKAKAPAAATHTPPLQDTLF